MLRDSTGLGNTPLKMRFRCQSNGWEIFCHALPLFSSRDKANGSGEQTATRDAVYTTTASQAPKFLEKERSCRRNEPGQLEPSLEAARASVAGRLRHGATIAATRCRKNHCPPAGSCRGAGKADGERSALWKGARRRTRAQCCSSQ